MAFIVNCTSGISIIKKEDGLQIMSGYFTLKLYSWHKVREFLLSIYLLNEKERDIEDGEEPKCFIEIITSNNSDLVLNYPYSLRHLMLDDYVLLKEALKPYMKED
jgi:hypothetical protein